MMSAAINYEAGRQDYQAWSQSPQFQQFDRGTPLRDIMRLFLPPVPEDMMQVQRPLPGPYQEWARGFREAEAEAAAESAA